MKHQQQQGSAPSNGGGGGGSEEQQQQQQQLLQQSSSTTLNATTTIGEAYSKAVALLSSSSSSSNNNNDPVQALSDLQVLQERVASLSLFSRNESLEDISTGSLPLIALEHYLAIAYTQQPMSSNNSMNNDIRTDNSTFATTTINNSRANMMKKRQGQLHRACDLWMNFLQRIEQLELFTNNSQEQKEYERLSELVNTTMLLSSSSTDDDDESSMSMPPIMPGDYNNRDAKIARFQAKKQVQEQRAKYLALQERRKRLNMLPTDEMDGHDEESLSRTLALQSLELAKHEALEELSSVLRELPMIAHMLRQEEETQRHQTRYNTKSSSNNNNNGNGRGGGGPSQRPPQGSSSSSGPLKLTHITKNALTGELAVRREEVQSQVFRRGWNQPTMTLEELAEKEVAQALERDERQKQGEAAAKNAPRRYEQLVKDGMDDNVDLVDASAALDRQWDDWKDENPRGSGNKRGDVGDRNF